MRLALPQGGYLQEEFTTPLRLSQPFLILPTAALLAPLKKKFLNVYRASATNDNWSVSKTK